MTNDPAPVLSRFVPERPAENQTSITTRLATHCHKATYERLVLFRFVQRESSSVGGHSIGGGRNGTKDCRRRSDPMTDYDPKTALPETNSDSRRLASLFR